jgi:hypothetical protein
VLTAVEWFELFRDVDTTPAVENDDSIGLGEVKSVFDVKVEIEDKDVLEGKVEALVSDSKVEAVDKVVLDGEVDVKAKIEDEFVYKIVEDVKVDAVDKVALDGRVEDVNNVGKIVLDDNVDVIDKFVLGEEVVVESKNVVRLNFEVG